MVRTHNNHWILLGLGKVGDVIFRLSSSVLWLLGCMYSSTLLLHRLRTGSLIVFSRMPRVEKKSRRALSIDRLARRGEHKVIDSGQLINFVLSG